ncbi:MAG: hypothetical protein F9K29_12305 [Hyphomicrobiaceae bacterium]|nr:MAG: hypothetical protein F9K29_12305 [Hyphomicrobiaceae bacterium]
MSGARLFRGGVAFVLTTALGVALMAASGGGPAGWIRLAQAQQGTRDVLVVAAIVHAQPASKTRLPIQISSQATPPKNSFVRVRGLPLAASLSDGYAVAPGAWAVPLAALPGLNVILPVGLQGSSEITVSLVSIEGTVLAEARTILSIGAPPAPASSQPTPAANAPAVPLLSPAERERALGLHAKGQEQLERGSVYAARKFFEKAAEAGLSQSAVALAATYDPNELAKLKVIGLQPDVDAARKWYERARELGAAEAAERLRLLQAVR